MTTRRTTKVPKPHAEGCLESVLEEVLALRRQRAALRKALEDVMDTAHHTRCREVTGYGGGCWAPGMTDLMVPPESIGDLCAPEPPTASQEPVPAAPPAPGRAADCACNCHVSMAARALAATKGD